MHDINMDKYNIRTDMVSDLGVKGYKNYDKNGIKVSWVKLSNNNVYKRKAGTYLTIDFENILDTEHRDYLISIFIKELTSFFKLCKYKKENKVLVIGLGNKKCTPDSLGPLVCEDIIVTSHMHSMKLDVDKRMGNVSTFVPGVMGVTGINTYSLVKGVIKETKPDMVILVDALASSTISRLNRSIQVTNSAITPGSGVGTNTHELSKKSLGVPVIIIGVPTVTSMSVIIKDTINNMNINIDNDMMVTPKEIDTLIEKLSEVISTSLNRTLHNI